MLLRVVDRLCIMWYATSVQVFLHTGAAPRCTAVALLGRLGHRAWMHVYDLLARLSRTAFVEQPLSSVSLPPSLHQIAGRRHS